MIILYSTGCPKCKVLKMKLEQKGIEYTECNDTAKMEELGISTIPILQVDDKFMDFETAVKYVNSK